MTEIRHEAVSVQEGAPAPRRNKWLRPALAATAVATAAAVTFVVLPSSGSSPAPAKPPRKSTVALLEDIDRKSVV